jgi:hypothetical protein
MPAETGAIERCILIAEMQQRTVVATAARAELSALRKREAEAAEIVTHLLRHAERWTPGLDGFDPFTNARAYLSAREEGRDAG